MILSLLPCLSADAGEAGVGGEEGRGEGGPTGTAGEGVEGEGEAGAGLPAWRRAARCRSLSYNK